MHSRAIASVLASVINVEVAETVYLFFKAFFVALDMLLHSASFGYSCNIRLY